MTYYNTEGHNTTDNPKTYQPRTNQTFSSPETRTINFQHFFSWIQHQVLYLLHDMEQHQTYVLCASLRVARQIVTNFDGRRLERLGPGELPDSCLRQNVKLEMLWTAGCCGWTFWERQNKMGKRPSGKCVQSATIFWMCKVVVACGLWIVKVAI